MLAGYIEQVEKHALVGDAVVEVLNEKRARGSQHVDGASSSAPAEMTGAAERKRQT